MEIQPISRFLSSTLAAGLILGSLPTLALARSRVTSVWGSQGGFSQRSVVRHPGYASRGTTATNAAGQSVSHRFSRSSDSATRSLQTSASTTLADGRTASRTFDSHRTETGHTTSASAQGFNGKTASYQTTTTKTDTGYIREASVAGSNGATASKQVSVTTQGGVTTRTVITSETPPHS